MLKFIFHTENINPRLYKRAIRKFVYNTVGPIWYKTFSSGWTFEIFPMERAKEDPHFHGQEGVGGVTGMGLVKLYLEDTETKQNDTFQRVFRKNMVVVSHEACHAILIHQGFNQKEPLRHDDFGGNKKGKMLNVSTQEVHDRHSENNFWNMDFWFWDWKLLIPRKMFCRVLDIRDFVK